MRRPRAPKVDAADCHAGSNEGFPRGSLRSAPLSVPQNGRVVTRIRLSAEGSGEAPGARLGVPPAATVLIVIELDIGRAVVTLADKEVELVRDIAAAQAGRSAASRDLSLLLNQALTSRSRIALQRGEVNALRQIIAADRRLTRLLTTFEQPASVTRAS